MTYMEKRDPNYHWIPDLYKGLNLLVYEGIQEAVMTSNIKKETAIGQHKTREGEEKENRVVEVSKERSSRAS